MSDKTDLLLNVGIANSKEMSAEFSKELDAACKKIASGATEAEINRRFSKIAKQFGSALSVEIKNAFGEVLTTLNFNKLGKELKRVPRNLEQEFNRSIPTRRVSTIAPESTNRRKTLEMDISYAVEKGIEKGLKKFGASNALLNKIETQGVAKTASNVNFQNGKVTTTFNSEGNTFFASGAAEVEKGTLIVKNLEVIGVNTNMTEAGQPALKQSTQALSETKKLENLREKLEEILKLSQETNKSEEGQLEITNRLKEVKAKLVQAEEARKAVLEKGTKAQQDQYKHSEEMYNLQKEGKEAQKQIAKLEEEQSDNLSQALQLQKDISKLKKENIEYGDKANGGELKAFNNQQIEQKEKELELKKAILSTSQKETLAEQEKKNKLDEQILQLRKIYKLRSSKNTKGTFLDEFETAFGRVTTYGAAYGFVNQIKNGIKKTVEIVTKFDKLMNGLSIVTQGQNIEVRTLTQSYISLAKELGTTSEKVFEAADLWLRQGRTIAETNKLIEATMVMANVAQIDSAKSANILTSAINGFKLEAKDAMHVVDVFAAVDLAAAANTEELAEAMQRVAATAGEVGISFENITSYVATLVDATRLDAGTIGSSLNTILSRMQNIKLGNLVNGDETLSDVQKALSQVQIDLFDVNGTFRDMDAVLGDIAKQWTTLNDVEKSSIAYAVAGMEYLYAGYVLEYMVTYSHLRYQKAKMA